MPQVLSRTDKVILSFLAIVVIGASFFIWQNHWLKTTKELPANGGTFSEGIVGEPKDLEKHIARLTGAGLTKLQSDGNVSPDIAESWEILDQGKTYQFKLRDKFNSYDLATYLENKNIWPNIEVETPDELTIRFKFKQPFSPFLYTSSEPIFPYGPYKIVREEKTKITFQSRDDYWDGRAHLDKIVLNLYPNQNELDKGLKHKEVQGYLSSKKQENLSSEFNSYDLVLPRETILFFNLARPELANLELRKKLRDNTPVGKELTFKLVTSDKEKYVEQAKKLKQSWQPLGVNLEIETHNNADLQKNVIPKREYDLLLFGLDYGPDPDPYPFWHSSQNKAEGMNLSGFNNKKADKLLEEARQSFDFKVREAKYNEFRQILNDEVPSITIDKEVLYYIVSEDVKGIEKLFGFSETDRFLNVDTWFTKVKRVTQ